MYSPCCVTAGMRLRIVKSSFANPVVNIRIIPADLESTYNQPANTFRPEFLKHLEVKTIHYLFYSSLVGVCVMSRVRASYFSAGQQHMHA